MAGVNQEFGQKAYNPGGGGEIAVYDTYTGDYHPLGKVTNIRYTPQVEHYDQMQVTSGEEVVTQRRVRSRRGSLSFVCAEMFDPKVNQLIFGDQEVAQTDAGDNTAVERQRVTLWGTEKQKLEIIDAHAAALVATYGTPTITSATPSADNGGANWTPASTTYLYAVPIWGDPASATYATATGYSALLDIDYWAGTPTAGENVTITNADDTVDVVMASYDPSPLDAPDYWACFVNEGADAVASAVGCAVTGATTAGGIFKAFVDADTLVFEGPCHASTPPTYAAAVGCAVQDITTYGATPAYTKLVSGTDYTYDSANGTIVRIAAGSWVDGDECRVSYWVWKPDSVTTKMGARRSGTTTRQLRIRHFEPEVDKTSTDPTTFEGQEIIIWRADFSGVSTEIAYNDDAFAEGMPVDVECMFDQENNGIGTLTTFSRKTAGRVVENAKYR